jgi:hypothetical protein
VHAPPRVVEEAVIVEDAERLVVLVDGGVKEELDGRVVPTLALCQQTYTKQMVSAIICVTAHNLLIVLVTMVCG